MKPDKLKSKLKDLPETPGVYMFIGSKGKVLYVGKALRLKRRVASYFRAGRAKDNRLELLANEVRDIKIINTSSEAEALIYETGLIKNHAPKFNIELKDDKSYPFLKFTEGEEYPRLFITRRRMNDGSVYYGPYVNVKLLKEAVSFMKKVFPLRSCRSLHRSICLEYHIGQCAGPCEGKIKPSEYCNIVDQMKKFLEGRKSDLISSMEKEMRRFSRDKKYEKAISVKKRIEALTAVKQFHDRAQRPIYGELDELQSTLSLSSLPVVIECFDISNIVGQQAVGAMVKFIAGMPRKKEYRKFRIKSIKGIDDCAMIREVVGRRYTRLLREKETRRKVQLPDLVLIDGGRGHLSAASDELNKLGLDSITVASIAKEHNHLYITDRRQPVRLSPGSRLTLLIQRVRDEAHRFAIKYHRRLRSSERFDTELKQIRGVGPVRERMLLEKFGNRNNIRMASVEKIKEAGIDKRTARSIKRYFTQKG